jgi:hypothetical protein
MEASLKNIHSVTLQKTNTFMANSPTLRRNKSPPSSGLNIKPRKECQNTETSAKFYRTTQRYNLKLCILPSHRRQNLKSNAVTFTVTTSSAFLRNVDKGLRDYMVSRLHSRRGRLSTVHLVPSLCETLICVKYGKQLKYFSTESPPPPAPTTIQELDVQSNLLLSAALLLS